MNNTLEIEIGYLIKNVYDLEELKNNSTAYVRDVFKNKKEFICMIKENSKKKFHSNNYIHNNILYMEGIFTIKYNYMPIIPIENWDYVPELIAYFLNALEECISERESEFSYPDQPINIKLKLDNQHIILAINNNTYKIEKNLFVKTFLKKTKMFFEIIRNELGILSYDEEIKQIDNLYKQYNLSSKNNH